MRGKVVLLLPGLLLTHLQAFDLSTVATFSIDKSVHAIRQFSHFHVHIMGLYPRTRPLIRLL